MNEPRSIRAPAATLLESPFGGGAFCRQIMYIENAVPATLEAAAHYIEAQHVRHESARVAQALASLPLDDGYQSLLRGLTTLSSQWRTHALGFTPDRRAARCIAAQFAPQGLSGGCVLQHMSHAGNCHEPVSALVHAIHAWHVADVVRGQPARSPPITRLIRFGGPMFRVVSDAELAIIEAWIMSFADRPADANEELHVRDEPITRTKTRAPALAQTPARELRERTPRCRLEARELLLPTARHRALQRRHRTRASIRRVVVG